MFFKRFARDGSKEVEKKNDFTNQKSITKADLDSIFLQNKSILDNLNELNKKIDQMSFHDSKFQDSTTTMLWLLKPEARSISDIQNEFWLSYPEAKGNMKTIHLCNLWLMERFKEICETNGLNFWLHGGTLIGAVRHEGFIPWDDDVDLAMKREDLERLINILDKNDEFKIFQYYHDDVNFSRAYQFKLRDESLPNFLDIFVFDFCNCESLDQREQMLAKARTVRLEMVHKFLNIKNKPKVLDVGYRNFGPFSSKEQKKADDIILDFLERMAPYRKGNCIYYSIENYPFPYPVLKTTDIFPTKKVLFMGKMFDIPNNYHDYLVGYGDILQPPSDMGKETPHYYWYEPRINEMKDFLKRIDYKG